MSVDKAQCSATCSSFFHATRWLIASSLSFIRRHLVSDREKPLNTLSIHTFHPGLPGRYSWPLIRSAFCNYSTHLLSGVRDVQLVQALLALPCSSFVTARPLRHFYLTTLSSPAFLAFVSRFCHVHDYCYILSPDDSQRSGFRFRSHRERERGPRRDRSLLWTARSFCKDVKTVPRDKRSSTYHQTIVLVFI